MKMIKRFRIYWQERWQPIMASIHIQHVLQGKLLFDPHAPSSTTTSSSTHLQHHLRRTTYRWNDPNGSCLFSVGSPTDTVGSQNIQTFSTRQTPRLGDCWGELTTTTNNLPMKRLLDQYNNLRFAQQLQFLILVRVATQWISVSSLFYM